MNTRTPSTHAAAGLGPPAGGNREVRWALAVMVLVAVALVTLIVVTVSIRRDEGNDSAATSRVARTHAGLCAALRLADEGDGAGARTAFYDRAHEGLHELAAVATDVEPATAAPLLVAKQRVEALLEGTPARADLTTALAGLADATDRAGDVVGESVLERCD